MSEDSQCGVSWAIDLVLIVVGVCCLFRGLRTAWLFVVSEFKSVNLKKYGPGSWAVITGSTDGIGKGFAEELAKQGFNIYQIARNPDKLMDCEAELISKYSVQVFSRTWDFLKCSPHLETFTQVITQDLSDKDVSILVNNVGAVKPGYFHEASLPKLNEMLTLNCMPIVYISRLVLARMQLRRLPSAIINISSVSAISPISGSSVYSATKKFDDFFTEILANSSKNVVFMSLRPGYVLTQMTRHIKQLSLVISANECANAALRDLGSDLTFVGHIKHKFKAWTFSMLSEGNICQLSMKQRIGVQYTKYSM